MSECRWCNIDERCEANSVHYENPLTGDDISVMFVFGEIQIGFNGEYIGASEISYCPICGRKLREGEVDE